MKNNKPSLIKRIGKIALIVLCSLLAFVIVLLLGAHLFTPLVFHDFFKDAEKEFRIPGLSDGVVPQGFTYLPDEQCYLMCGYMTDGESASRIYIIPAGDPDKAYYINLVTKDGTPYTGHTGGIASYGNYIWLANDGEGEDNCVWVLSVYDLFRLEAGESLALNISFQPECRAAYCLVNGNALWIGEFHRPVDYPTKDSHAFTVADGEQNRALICAYPLDDNSTTGIQTGAPTVILSVPDHVQGFVRTQDGGFILSTSYGLSKSHLYFHENVLSGEADTTMTVDGSEVPVWFLDNESLLRDLEAPPMSEEMVVRDGRLYFLTESACKKYIFGNFIRGRHVYSIPISN